MLKCVKKSLVTIRFYFDRVDRTASGDSMSSTVGKNVSTKFAFVVLRPDESTQGGQVSWKSRFPGSPGSPGPLTGGEDQARPWQPWPANGKQPRLAAPWPLRHRHACRSRQPGLPRYGPARLTARNFNSPYWQQQQLILLQHRRHHRSPEHFHIPSCILIAEGSRLYSLIICHLWYDLRGLARQLRIGDPTKVGPA